MSKIFEFGECILNCERFELTRTGRRVKIEPKAMELLILLVSGHGRLITRDEIAASLWHPGVFVDVNTAINTLVRKIRYALRDNIEKPRYIETVSAKGYRLVSELNVRYRLNGSSIHSLDRAAAEPVCIAVLPFVNLSPSKENEYFGDGLAEEIINQLTNVPRMKVASRTSSFFFRQSNIEPAEIGRRLSVKHILEGSIRKSDNRVRITVQLIQASDGFQLWSERYDREMTDIFTVQDEITAAVVSALRFRLTPPAVPPRRYIPKFRAYEAYLKARSIWFGKNALELLGDFRESLELAIELDPQFALARSFLGLYYTMKASLNLEAPRVMIPAAIALEQEALQVDPRLPEAHALLGVCVGEYGYDWEKSERHWQLAMDQQPVSRDVVFWYGNHFLMPLGRVQEAIGAMERGLQGDPLNLLYRHHYARALRLAGMLGEAETELRTILEIDPALPYACASLGSLCAQQGRYGEALALTERAHKMMPWSLLWMGQLAAMLVQTGAQASAEPLLERLKASSAYGKPAGLLIFYLLCGKFDQAEEWAARAVEERDMQLIQNMGVFLWPRSWWPKLARRMNLPG